MRSTSAFPTATRASRRPSPNLLSRVAAMLSAALALALVLAAATAPTAPRASGDAVVVLPGAPLPTGADEVRRADPAQAQRTAALLRAQGLSVRIAR